MALRGAYVAGGQGEWNICRWDGVLFQTPPPYIAKGGNIYTNCANNIRFDNFPDIQEFFNVPSDLNLIRATMKRNCDYIKIIIQIFIRERERNCKLLRLRNYAWQQTTLYSRHGNRKHGTCRHSNHREKRSFRYIQEVK